MIVVRLTADRPGSVSFTLSLTSEQPGGPAVAEGSTIAWRGKNRDSEGIAGRLTFAIRAHVSAVGGTVVPTGAALRVEGADEALVIVDAATSFRAFDDIGGDPDAALSARAAGVADKSWLEIRAAHVAEHQRLFRRLSIDLGRSGNADLPTDERIAANPQAPDPALAALYFQYGRYLMISFVAPGHAAGEPPGHLERPDRSAVGQQVHDQHQHQMNYWLPDPANLGECMEPLIRLVEELSATGARDGARRTTARAAGCCTTTPTSGARPARSTARSGACGRPAAPGSASSSGTTPSSAAVPSDWSRRLYPLHRGRGRASSSTFWCRCPGTDWLVTNPSLSPENVHPHGASALRRPGDGQPDRARPVRRAARRVGSSSASTMNSRRGAPARCRGCRRTASARPASSRSGSRTGTWRRRRSHHRHVSHLYGLYPSQQIDLDRTPELAAAARRSLEIRGDDATGWGIGWRSISGRGCATATTPTTC